MVHHVVCLVIAVTVVNTTTEAHIGAIATAVATYCGDTVFNSNSSMLSCKRRTAAAQSARESGAHALRQNAHGTRACICITYVSTTITLAGVYVASSATVAMRRSASLKKTRFAL
jgi:hypothetical protein